VTRHPQVDPPHLKMETKDNHNMLTQLESHQILTKKNCMEIMTQHRHCLVKEQRVLTKLCSNKGSGKSDKITILKR
jgi:hypothetical protein